MVHVRELQIPHAFEVTPVVHSDDRGDFLEWYRFEPVEDALGHPLVLRQANMSVSQRGVLRGIHYADVPPGQAKYVTAVTGAVLDFVVDLRVGSPAFGQWDSVLLDAVDRRAIYLPEGVGHAFVALTDDATVSYLVSETFNADREHGISPLDVDIALSIPAELGTPILSPKDAEAPTFAQARDAGLLPTWDSAIALYAQMQMAGR